MRPVYFSKHGGGDMKENDGEWYAVSTYVNVTVYPQYNNNINKSEIDRFLKVNPLEKIGFIDGPCLLNSPDIYKPD
jgi:hypothetical protein